MTTQAQNNINLCKGNSPEKILQLWALGNIKPSIIDEIADHYKIQRSKDAVAIYLSGLKN